MTRLRAVVVYRCDACGVEFEWVKMSDPSHYGSVAMREICPQDAPTVCSPVCRDKFQERMDTGEVEVPRVKLVGPGGHRVVGRRRGY